ncbi:hypothetical protein CFC21_016503 [Triticum aestivum]|uniref:Gnk2-homologous domain-containing protein n=2 Tax=Triticum aestivum TaxID=4565 RepID=A0A3B6AWH8_WHEAT|nr:hypothetical protein CFC21_016503 [Triticum aestivum]
MASHHRGRIPSYLATAAALLLAFLLPPLAASQWPNCGNKGNFTTNSPYQANIRALSTTLPKNASSSRTLFAADSVGTVPDIVYALALCRGDANASACGNCVSNGFNDAQKLCPYGKDAAVYYDLCYVGFSNQNILSATGGGNSVLILMSDNNVTAPVEAFDAAVGVLMNATADYAAANNSRRFGTGVGGFETVDKRNPKIYGVAQCRPDMAPGDCRSCLGSIIAMRSQYLIGRQGGRILGLRCNYRYEQYSFFTGPSMLQLPAPTVGVAPAPAPASVGPPPVGGGELGEITSSCLHDSVFRPEVISQLREGWRSFFPDRSSLFYLHEKV